MLHFPDLFFLSLSLSVAFLDARNGMVNLVVEYMDGGSLQDLVDRGGCEDEQVLADIAHQVWGGALTCAVDTFLCILRQWRVLYSLSCVVIMI